MGHFKFLLNGTKELPWLTRQVCKVARVQSNADCFVSAQEKLLNIRNICLKNRHTRKNKCFSNQGSKSQKQNKITKEFRSLSKSYSQMTYPKSLRANATAQKLGTPLLTTCQQTWMWLNAETDKAFFFYPNPPIKTIL